MVGIDPLGAIGGNSLDIAAIHGFGGHIPFTGVGRIQNLDLVPGIAAGAEHLIHELLVDFLGYPVDTDPDADFTGSQIHRLHRCQSFNVPGKQFFLFGW